MKVTILNTAPGKETYFNLKAKAESEGKQFIDVRLSMCDVDDFDTLFIGLSKQLPKWVYKANSHPTVFVFDEYNCTLLAVKKIVDTLLDTNTLGEGDGKFTDVFNDNVEVFVLSNETPA